MEPIVVKDENFILKEAYVDSNQDTVWEIKDISTQNNFYIHTSNCGKMYITFFKRQHISNKCSQNAIKKVCEILVERKLTPTIKIHHENLALITLCRKVGFRKVKNVKSLYSFKRKTNTTNVA